MTTPANDITDFEKERPGWIWILTIQNMPDEMKDSQLMDEDEYDDFDIDGDIVGCYATRDLMLADMKKMGAAKYGMFHMLVEGWKEHPQQ